MTLKCESCPYGYKTTPTSCGASCGHPKSQTARPFFGRTHPRFCPAIVRSERTSPSYSGRRVAQASKKPARWDGKTRAESMEEILRLADLLDSTEELDAQTKEDISSTVMDGTSCWCIATLISVVITRFGPSVGIAAQWFSHINFICHAIQIICILAVCVFSIRKLQSHWRLQDAGTKLDYDIMAGIARAGLTPNDVATERELRLQVEMRHREEQSCYPLPKTTP